MLKSKNEYCENPACENEADCIAITKTETLMLCGACGWVFAKSDTMLNKKSKARFISRANPNRTEFIAKARAEL